MQYPCPKSPSTLALLRDDRGLSTVEYVIILVLIVAGAVGTWQLLGSTVRSKLDDSNAAIRDLNGQGTNSGSSQESPGSPSPAPAPVPPPAQGQAKGKWND